MHGDTAAPLTPWVPTGWPRSQQHPQLLLSPFLGSAALCCCFCWLLGSTQTADPVLLLLRCSSWITTSLAGVLLPALRILGGTHPYEANSEHKTGCGCCSANTLLLAKEHFWETA